MLTRKAQVNHAGIEQHVAAVNRMFADPIITRFWNPLTAAGRAALDAVIDRQALIISYIDDCQLLMFAIIAALPLLIVLQRTSCGSDRGDAIVVE